MRLFQSFSSSAFFFSIGFVFLVVFPFLRFWYSLLLLLLSSDILGGRFCFWDCYFSSGSGCDSAFLCPLYQLFLHAAVRAGPCGLTRRFSACCGYGWVFPVFLCVFHLLRLRLSLPVPLRFSVCCDFGCSFRSSSPSSTSCASSCSFALARLMLSYVLQVLRLQFLGCPGAAFPAFLLVFYRRDFTDWLVYHCFGPQAAFSPLLSAPPRACLWCSSLRLRFFLCRSALLCLVWHYGSLVLLTRSDLQLPL